MMIKYEGEWIPIENAVSQFDSTESLKKAAEDMRIRTRGRIQDSMSPDVLEDYQEVPLEAWCDFDFCENTFILIDPYGDSNEGRTRDYRCIEVSKYDLLLCVLGKRFSDRSNEMQDAIQEIFIDMYIKNHCSEFPSAGQVFNEVEKRQKNISCVERIDRKPDGSKAIWWKSCEGKADEMKYNSFENLLSKLRVQIKSLENHY